MDDAGTRYLNELKVEQDSPVFRAMSLLENTLNQSARAPLEESVPVDMMQLFSEAQWPQLRFEFQPSMAVIFLEFDVVELQHCIKAGQSPAVPVQENPRHWLIFSDNLGQLVRPLQVEEYKGINLARKGLVFARIAVALWPDLTVKLQYNRMTDMLMGWLSEGLLIDAGVALPPEAEFESPPAENSNQNT